MEELEKFEISSNGNSIRIDLIGLSHPNSEYIHDRNWISGKVKAKAGSFYGEFTADFQTLDFPRFKKQLEELYQKLNGEAQFTTLEGQVKITITGESGNLIAICELLDFPGYGNFLKFEIEFDQSHLPKIITQLSKISNEFPIFRLD